MLDFIKKLFSTKCLTNNRSTGFLNAINRERNMDIFIERDNQALASKNNP